MAINACNLYKTTGTPDVDITFPGNFTFQLTSSHFRIFELFKTVSPALINTAVVFVICSCYDASNVIKFFGVI